MKKPNPVNLTASAEVEALGWAAEARDSDGHLISTQAWLKQLSINENIKDLGEFITEYDGVGGTAVQIFPANIKM